jgi:hypothetical protein
LKREHLAFLCGGFLFGVLVGAGLLHAIQGHPDLAASAAADSTVPGPQGPAAPTQVAPGGAPAAGGGGSDAPMMAEINELKRRVQADPRDLEALVRLADVYYEVGMWQQAAGYYERALTLRPDDPNLLTDLGISYRGLREFDRALEQFSRAQRVDPRHWQSLFNTAVVAAFDVGRFDLADQALRAIAAIQPPPAELGPERLEQLARAVEQARTRSNSGAAPS